VTKRKTKEPVEAVQPPEYWDDDDRAFLASLPDDATREAVLNWWSAVERRLTASMAAQEARIVALEQKLEATVEAEALAAALGGAKLDPLQNGDTRFIMSLNDAMAIARAWAATFDKSRMAAARDIAQRMGWDIGISAGPGHA
jgi:hypothetical protein